MWIGVWCSGKKLTLCQWWAWSLPCGHWLLMLWEVQLTLNLEGKLPSLEGYHYFYLYACLLLWNQLPSTFSYHDSYSCHPITSTPTPAALIASHHHHFLVHRQDHVPLLSPSTTGTTTFIVANKPPPPLLLFSPSPPALRRGHQRCHRHCQNQTASWPQPPYSPGVYRVSLCTTGATPHLLLFLIILPFVKILTFYKSPSTG